MDPRKVDPNLRAALAAAKAGGDEIEAVVVLNPTDPERGVDSPDETVRKGNAIVARVCEQVGSSPRAVNVFEHMQSMSVRADADFIEKLIEQPEVDAALANRSISGTDPARKKGRAGF